MPSAFDNWPRMIGPADIAQHAFDSFQQGRQLREERETRGALAAYAMNPDDTKAVQTLAQYRPEYLMAAREKRQAQERADLPMLGRLLTHARQGPQQWQEALSEGQRLGIDTSKVPQQYAPEWADHQLELVKTMADPKSQEALSAVGKEASDAGYKVGTPEYAQFVRERLSQSSQFTLLNKRFDANGKVIAEAPFAPEHAVVERGKSVVEWTPGGGSTPSGGGPLTVDTLRPLFVAQESSGDYTAVNKGTGALGAYQVMPQTGASLAQKLGLPWQPELMTQNTPEAKQYQDKIGGAAIQDSIAAGGGDAARTFSHYYSGNPDAYGRPGNPKTTAYVHDMTARLGAGGASTAPGTRVIADGGPAASKEREAPSGYRWKADGTLEAIPGGPGDKQGRQANLKPPPNKALTDFQENQASLKTVNDALALLDAKNNSPAAQAARDAIGPGTGALGTMFTQLHDPAGNDFRALLGRVAGIIIKDTSGAAVSASEDARLAQWVPKATDTVAAARSKLRNLANAIANNNSAFDDIYNEDNGYRPIHVGRGPAAAASSGWGQAKVVP